MSLKCKKQGTAALTLVLVALALGLGCNPLGTIAFILEPEHMAEPKCVLTDKEKEVKLVVLCYHAGLEDRPELVAADRELAVKVVGFLEERYKENKDKVKIVHPNQVKNYLGRFADWHTIPPRDIGKHFGADYVINIELSNMNLYERGSRQLYHGKADVALTVIDVSKPLGEGDKWSENWPAEYPSTGRLLDANEINPRHFCGRFLDNMARNISQRFASYPPKHRYDSDGIE